MTSVPEPMALLSAVFMQASAAESITDRADDLAVASVRAPLVLFSYWCLYPVFVSAKGQFHSDWMATAMGRSP